MWTCGSWENRRQSLQAGTATVSTLTDPATLDHLCHSRLQAGPPHTDSARLIFRALQAAAQCCLELQQRYAAGTAQAVQLSQGQLELMPTLQVGRCCGVCVARTQAAATVYILEYTAHANNVIAGCGKGTTGTVCG